MSDDAGQDDRWKQVWAIFHRARELPADAQPALLDEACGDDAELRRELEELLEAYEEEMPILDRTLPIKDQLPMPRTEVLEPGQVLAERFEIVRMIGRGGIGEVYEASDRELGTRVALKVLAGGRAQDADSSARFRREIQLAQRVSHRNVCRVHDLYREGDRLFLTMELVEGKTLADLLEEKGRLESDEAMRLVEQVVAGLEAAHELGIVHRDLKPSNILLVDDASLGLRVVVTDFGLATTHEPGGTGDPKLTRTGDVLGTPAYMAPEQILAELTTPATDVYALGLVLYEVLTGHRPLEGASAFSLAARRVEKPAPSPREQCPDLDPHWERVVLRCLERKPEDRFARPADVLAALSEPAAGVEPATVGSAGAKRWALAIGLAAAVVVAALIWWARPPAGEARPEAASQQVAGLGFERQDAVLIAAFENRTGDASLDGAVEAALAHELATSPFVTVAGRRRVEDALRLMRLPPDTKVDVDIARRVAQRDDGIRVLLAGAIDRTEGVTLISASLLDKDDGVSLTSWSTEVTGGEQGLIVGARELSRELRSFLGENLDQLEAEAVVDEKVSTPSLRALRLYDQAESIIARFGRDAVSEELLREAIREDPEFASAHTLLAFAIANQGRGDEAVPHARRAVELAEAQRLPEREMFFIRGSYHSLAGDIERGIANYQALVQLHPDHYWGNNNLGVFLGPVEGAPYRVQKARHRPNDLDANWDAAHALAIALDQPAEAQPFVDKVVELAAIEIPRWQDYEAAWARLFGAHRHWVAGDLEAMRADLDRWAERSHEMAGAEGHFMTILLAYGYRAAGVTDYETRVRLFPAVAHFLRGRDAYLRGDDASAVETLGAGTIWASRYWDTLLRQEPLRVAALARGGSVAEASHLREEFVAMTPSPTPHLEEQPEILARVMGLSIASEQGRLALDDEDLAVVRDHSFGNLGPGFFLTVGATASAIEREQGVAEAADYLKRVLDGSRESSYPLGVELWLDLRVEQLRLSREAGRADEARALESELRGLSEGADPSFWLLERLGTPVAR
jgi:hypothetical protein